LPAGRFITIMRKQIFGRQLQRDTNERKALFKSLMAALVLHESIQTTEAKAKAIRGQIEKLVTKAKTNSDAKRQLQKYFAEPVLTKFITDVAPRFMQRPGGYTRIVKMGNRLRDNAKMVVLEWVEKKEPAKAEGKETKTTTMETVEKTAQIAAPKKEKKTEKKDKKEVKKEPKKKTTKK